MIDYMKGTFFAPSFSSIMWQFSLYRLLTWSAILLPILYCLAQKSWWLLITLHPNFSLCWPSDTFLHANESTCWLLLIVNGVLLQSTDGKNSFIIPCKQKFHLLFVEIIFLLENPLFPYRTKFHIYPHWTWVRWNGLCFIELPWS